MSFLVRGWNITKEKEEMAEGNNNDPSGVGVQKCDQCTALQESHAQIGVIGDDWQSKKGAVACR
jgi:hypothetical protein